MTIKLHYRDRVACKGKRSLKTLFVTIGWIGIFGLFFISEGLQTTVVFNSISMSSNVSVPHLTLIDVLTEVLARVSLVTGAGVGALQVEAVSVATDVLHLTLVHIQAGPAVLLEPEARPAAALHRPPLE